jgi:glutamate/tyrosine decarboxylase-like PLP-dependent enzyme
MASNSADPIRPDPRPRAADPGRFGWHPEPGLLGLDDAATARPALEELGRETWNAALDYLYGEAFRRAMGEPATYPDLRQVFFGPTGAPAAPPRSPTPSAQLLDEFRTRLAPHQLNAWHPRTLSYFTPTPLALSVAGELLAQWTHQGVDVWHAGPTAAFVEEEVVRWLCDLVGYDRDPAGNAANPTAPGAGRPVEPGEEQAFGLITSGGVMANFIAMALVRDVHLGRIRSLDRPPRGAALEGVRVYTSDQAHFSVGRALDELGFPYETLAVLPADDDFRLQAAPVAQRIARDRAAGLTPLAIAAVAGTTNTGAVDAIEDLAALARQENLWFHVDAAYGGAARFSPRDAHRVPGLHLADSVTVDPHKWFFQAYDIGALVVREGARLEETFGRRRPEYYRGGERSGSTDGPHDVGVHPADGPVSFYKLGFEGTRRWRALKLWLSWRHVGSDGFARLVERNNDLAAYLAARIRESADFEACPAEPELSVVCFRHRPGGAEPDSVALDAHQDRLQAALEASGDGWLSTTRLRGATWLRAGILNYLTTEADIDRLLDRLRELARS